MAKKLNSKLKVLKILEILKTNTDDDHPMTASELCDELKKFNIDAERKSIYNDVKTLIDHGVDINKTTFPKKGFYIAKRDFELAEIKLLVDAVLSAKFITEKKTKKLIDKLDKLLSTHQANQITSKDIIDDINKFSNEEIYYNIDAINRAIHLKKKISFIYFNLKVVNSEIIFDNGKIIKISPYSMIWNSDKYFVMGDNEEYGQTLEYRLDKMKSVKILDEDINPCSGFESFTEKAELKTYESKEKVELICHKDALDIVIDEFNGNVKLTSSGKDQFIAEINTKINNSLIDWIIQNGDKVYVKSPGSLRNKIIEKIKVINNAYLSDYNFDYI